MTQEIGTETSQAGDTKSNPKSRDHETSDEGKIGLKPNTEIKFSSELLETFFMKKKLVLMKWERENANSYGYIDNILDITNLVTILMKNLLRKYKFIFVLKQVPLPVSQILKSLTNLLSQCQAKQFLFTVKLFVDELDNLLNSGTSEYSDSIAEWFSEFVYNSGVNSLTVDMTKLRRNFISKFNIVQLSRENHTSDLKFSRHFTDLMLINKEGQPQFHLDLNLPGIDVCQVQGLEGKFYPSACLLNHSGVGYFTV
jgi:hypothetical protein